MQTRFWGTRGSIAKPGPTTVRYGGNTSCVEVRADDGTLVILDCGTGAHGLGQALVAQGGPVRGHILIGHTHWDHIQGIPFFTPLFVEGNEWDIYAPRGLAQHLQDTLAGQMDYTYFPVALQDLRATIRYHDLVEGTFSVGGIRITTQYLNHPALTLGYRLEADGATLVYATDHEPHSRHLAMAEPCHDAAPGAAHREDERHRDFLTEADLLIHDAQYTAAEYPAKAGWGHSTVEYVVDMAVAARVRRLALFHHDPSRTDREVDDLVVSARRRAEAAGSPVWIEAATEGEVIRVQGARPVEGARLATAAAESEPEPERGRVIAVLEDPALFDRLQDAVRPDGLQLISAGSAQEAWDCVEARQPVLLLLDGEALGGETRELCARLRSDPLKSRVPVVLLVNSDSSAVLAGSEDEVTDWLVKPITPQYVRTKLRTWLLRAPAADPR